MSSFIAIHLTEKCKSFCLRGQFLRIRTSKTVSNLPINNVFFIFFISEIFDQDRGEDDDESDDVE